MFLLTIMDWTVDIGKIPLADNGSGKGKMLNDAMCQV